MRFSINAGSPMPIVTEVGGAHAGRRPKYFQSGILSFFPIQSCSAMSKAICAAS